MKKRRSLQFRFGPAGAPYTVTGRVAWTLAELHRAGTAGITAADYPGTRLSQYVHLLRRKGVHVETVRERHGGEFAGTHGRYVLRSHITIIPGTADGGR